MIASPTGISETMRHEVQEKGYIYEYDKTYHQEIKTGISLTVGRGKKKTKNEIVKKKIIKIVHLKI